MNVNQVNVVPNGVDTTQFKIYNKDVQRKWFERNFETDLADGINIIYVGRFSEEKGLRYLIKSLDYIDLPFKLFLAGDGPQKSEIAKLIEASGLNGKVCILGKVPHENLSKLLNAMDIFVLPSISMEGFSNSMLEAMACGLPIVTTHVGAGSEVITDDVGFVAEIKNPSQIADGILKYAYLDRNTIRDYTESHFSFDVVADKVYALYSDLCGKDVDSICYCSLYSPPYQLSGAGRQVHELSKRLSQKCDVSVISTGIGGSKDGQLEGVNYYRVKYVKGESLSRFCYSTLGCLKGLSLDAFDVVDGRNWEGGLISTFLSKHKGNQSVISFRGEGALEGPWIKNRINKYIAKRVDLMTATDSRTASKAERILNGYKGDA
ncbi:hypothetical protein J2755_000900 [Methanohalophilus levihalophilus]|uniref:glycosyltransferase family 4 protein n=1 Tax=Methanohalophilus levihalophilus TaxID=1431282 RepID=UPI001AE2B9C6|nr:glycosyltransferase family 4 protein [Methanohalophilus levihalophilus]MBP2029966.1 hypothetical protein [Methanohalophilus levihalophilus]